MSKLSHYIKLRNSAIGCDAKQFECDKYLDCDSCLEDKIKEHDKQIRADAIDEFARELHKGCSEMIKQTWGSNTAPISWAEAYADFKVDIDEIAKQLKEQE